MTREFYNPKEDRKDQPGSTDIIKLRKDYSDVRTGARQEDQLDGLYPGDNPELRNKSNRLGRPPIEHVNNESPEDHSYPTDEQRWPENKKPAK
jgi:hypothetical protein